MLDVLIDKALDFVERCILLIRRPPVRGVFDKPAA